MSIDFLVNQLLQEILFMNLVQILTFALMTKLLPQIRAVFRFENSLEDFRLIQKMVAARIDNSSCSMIVRIGRHFHHGI